MKENARDREDILSACNQSLSRAELESKLAREYGVAAAIIELLGIRSVRLMTNNPDKVEKLKEAGISVVDRIPVLIEPNEADESYLRTKRDRMGHMI